MSSDIRPRQRRQDLVVTDLTDETLVYDQRTQKAHCLSPTSALIWRHCDGRRTIADLTDILHRATGWGEDTLWLGLRQLDEAKLLDDPVVLPGEKARYTRRAVLKAGGAAIGGAVLLPVIANIVAPTPALAFSSGALCCSQPCSSFMGCCHACPFCPAGTCSSIP